MTDRSATAVYRGVGQTVSGWYDPRAAEQEAAEAEHPAQVDDMTDGQDGNAVRLEGREGQCEGFGDHLGGRVPNLRVTKVAFPPSRPRRLSSR